MVRLINGVHFILSYFSRGGLAGHIVRLSTLHSYYLSRGGLSVHMIHVRLTQELAFSTNSILDLYPVMIYNSNERVESVDEKCRCLLVFE